MDVSVKRGAGLEVSVSFGRFESDGLSWEKWSSFSSNKYLEEAGTLSTPGSVAQKKAYFEAHYKKIAAKKAEEPELEKALGGPVTLRPYVSTKENCVVNSSELDNEFGMLNGEGLAREVAQESGATLLSNEDIIHKVDSDDAGSPKGDKKGVCINGSSDTGVCINGSSDAFNLDAEKEDAVTAVKCESYAIEEIKNALNANVERADLDITKDDPSVESESSRKVSPEKPPVRKTGTEKSPVLKMENLKLSARNTAEKVTPSRKNRSLAGTAKTVVPPAKRVQTPVPGHSKPALTPTPTSASKTFRKQVNESPLPKSKTSIVGESKRAATTSLHMSLNMGSAKSLSGISMTRKSLIMDKMGDKDIVKRAFKTFQNRANESTSKEKVAQIKHMPPAASETKPSISRTPMKTSIPRTPMKTSIPRTPMKGHERPKKEAEKQASLMSQSGTMSHPLSKGSHKSSALERKNSAASAPAVGISSNEKSVKRKEFLKKLEEKSIAREAAKSQLAGNTKVQTQKGIH